VAGRIAVIDHGRLIANGTADELKAQVGGERLEVRLEAEADLPAAMRALAPMSAEAPVPDGTVVRLSVREHRGAVMEAAQRARNGRLHENLVSHSAYEGGHSRRS
jgi:ABC-2 type transport system ATP-binding protein